MRYEAVIFDYGNTLVSYYTRTQWPAVFEQCLRKAAALVRNCAGQTPPWGQLCERAGRQHRSGMNITIRPMEDRLQAVFGSPNFELERMDCLCRAFLEPIFNTARLHGDVLPALAALRAEGTRLGALSNLPWGSPWKPWHDEIARHGIFQAVDAAVTCREAGFRKPAPQPFELIASRLTVNSHRCVFVGDDPRWDIVDARSVGMDVVLIDRHGEWPPQDCPTVKSLATLMELLR